MGSPTDADQDKRINSLEKEKKRTVHRQILLQTSRLKLRQLRKCYGTLSSVQ
jgi:hypothetical protein